MTGPEASLPAPFEAQHGSLRALLADLDDVEDLRRAVRLLEALRAELGPHFAEEERPGGLFDAVVAAAYGQERAVEALRHEHVALAEELDGTLEQARACLRGPVAAALRRAAQVSARVRAHERKESAAWLEATYAESGGSE